MKDVVDCRWGERQRRIRNRAAMGSTTVSVPAPGGTERRARGRSTGYERRLSLGYTTVNAES
eukprot:scaffold421372_cov69-Attheya_sp.AAC.1